MERAEQIILESLGGHLSIKLRQSIRARNIAIRIKGKEVELVLPKNGNKNKALEFLLKKEGWIRNKLVSTERATNDKAKLFTKIPILGDDLTSNILTDQTNSMYKKRVAI